VKTGLFYTNTMAEEIINRVASSGLITIKLEELIPAEIVCIDVRENLFMGMILKEKDFRMWVKDHDWEQYSGKCVGVYCSTDAIIPTWAYMILASKLAPLAEYVCYGNETDVLRSYFQEKVATMDLQQYEGKMMVIKGCSDKPVPEFAYVELTKRLVPVAKSIMFGEPCSTVPVFKKR
jgi:hypothetical protein